MRKLLLGATAFATLALFSGVASAQSANTLAAVRISAGRINLPLVGNATAGVPLEANAIAAFGAGAGAGIGGSINGSFGTANG